MLKRLKKSTHIKYLCIGFGITHSVEFVHCPLFKTKQTLNKITNTMFYFVLNTEQWAKSKQWMIPNIKYRRTG
jgi:hypothetical protein